MGRVGLIDDPQTFHWLLGYWVGAGILTAVLCGVQTLGSLVWQFAIGGLVLPFLLLGGIR